jgi:hypothetical protein
MKERRVIGSFIAVPLSIPARSYHIWVLGLGCWVLGAGG